MPVLEIRVRLVTALVVFVIILSGLAAFGLHRHKELINNVRFRFQQHVGAHPLISGGQLIGEYNPALFCQEAEYEGKATLLYSNRPYHTEETIEIISGYHFCRSKRHAETYSLIEVLSPTTIYAIGVETMRFDLFGWDNVPAKALIRADGLALDRMYRKYVLPGRYIVNHAFNKTSVPVFWNADHIRVVH